MTSRAPSWPSIHAVISSKSPSPTRGASVQTVSRDKSTTSPTSARIFPFSRRRESSSAASSTSPR